VLTERIVRYVHQGFGITTGGGYNDHWQFNSREGDKSYDFASVIKKKVLGENRKKDGGPFLTKSTVDPRPPQPLKPDGNAQEAGEVGGLGE